MILENSPQELRTLILLEFTKRMIISKNPLEFLIKKEQPKTKAEEFAEKIKKKIPEIEIKAPVFFAHAGKPVQARAAPALVVPETRLPPQFAYLKPTAAAGEINLGKLNPFLADPAVRIIETNGPGQQVFVRGSMGTKPTGITLSNDEISSTIDTFSKKAKIPAGEGAVKIAFGNFLLSAIVSEEAGSRFVITKLPKTAGSERRVF